MIDESSEDTDKEHLIPQGGKKTEFNHTRIMTERAEADTEFENWITQHVFAECLWIG